MKIIKQLFKIIFLCFTFFWLCSILRCEYLTWKYSSGFPIPKEVGGMIDGKDSMKILEYSNNHTIVYFVSSQRSSGDIVEFILINDKWVFSHWKTVWSKTGSADDFVWPYVR